MGQGSKKGNQVKLLKKVPENSEVMSIFLPKPEEKKFQDWNPGQFAVLQVKDEQGWSEPHPFTLSCAPEEDYLRMTIKKAGNFTSSVHELNPGEEVFISGPFGKFCQEVKQQDKLLLIAGGVGITPFLNVLRHFVKTEANKDICLFWVNKTVNDAFALKELREISPNLSLKLILSLTREEIPKEKDMENIFYEQGRLSCQMLKKYTDPNKRAIYLCGPGAMQEQVLRELKECGVDPDRVSKEAFVWSKPKA